MSEDNNIMIDFGEKKDGEPDYTEKVGSKPLTLSGQSVWSGFCDVEVIRQDGTGVNLIEDLEVSFVAPSEFSARLRTLFEVVNALTIEGVPAMSVKFKRVEEKYKLPDEKIELDN